MLVALFGAVVFVVAGLGFQVPAENAAILAVVATFAIRTLSVWLGWRTSPIDDSPPPPPEA